MTDVMTAAPPEPPPAPPQHAGTAAPPPGEPSRRPGGTGAAWGAALIVIGGVLLLGRFAPAFTWWTLWPLVIVVAGIVQAVTPGKDGWSVAKLFDGLVTIAFGGVFLAITTGVVSWSVWGRIVTFWPVLVIALGFEILGKALHASWPKILGSLAIIAALVYSVAATSAGLDATGFPSMHGRGESYTLEEPVGTVQSADLTMDVGAASVRMASGTDLVSVVGRSPFGEPVVRVDRSGAPVKVDVSLGDGDQTMMLPGDFSADFDVNLSNRVLWDLTLDVGVADFTADFSDVSVADLDLKTGVSSCNVKLGDVPASLEAASVRVDTGISSVTLRIPDDAEARVEISSGISGNDVSGDFEKRDGGVWETPGFGAARSGGDPVWIIAVKSGIGSVTVDTY